MTQQSHFCDITYMWNKKKNKWYKWTYMQNRNRPRGIENKLNGDQRRNEGEE